MALSKVQEKTSVSAANVASLAAVFTSAPTQNNLLVCAANSDATVTMTSSGWTLARSQVNHVGLYCWYKVAGAGESSTVTVTPGASASTEMWVAEYSGNLTSLVLDAVSSANGAASTAAVASGTTVATAQADELAIAAFGWNADVGFPTGDTYTNSFIETQELTGVGSLNTRLTIAEKTLTATGAQTTTCTRSAGNNGVPSGLIVTFKAAAGGATPVTVTPSPANAVFTSAASATAATAVTPAPSSTAFSAAATATAATSVAPAAATAVFTSAATVTTAAPVDLGTVTAAAVFTAASLTTATTAVVPAAATAVFSTAGAVTASPVVAGTATAVFSSSAAAAAPTVVVPAAASSVYGASAVVTTPGSVTSSTRLPLAGVGN